MEQSVASCDVAWKLRGGSACNPLEVGLEMQREEDAGQNVELLREKVVLVLVHGESILEVVHILEVP